MALCGTCGTSIWRPFWIGKSEAVGWCRPDLDRRLPNKKDLGIPTIKYPVLCQARVWEDAARFSTRGQRDV